MRVSSTLWVWECSAHNNALHHIGWTLSESFTTKSCFRLAATLGASNCPIFLWNNLFFLSSVCFVPRSIFLIVSVRSIIELCFIWCWWICFMFGCVFSSVVTSQKRENCLIYCCKPMETRNLFESFRLKITSTIVTIILSVYFPVSGFKSVVFHSFSCKSLFRNFATIHWFYQSFVVVL